MGGFLCLKLADKSKKKSIFSILLGMQKKSSILKNFFSSEKNGGIILLICVIISLILANSSQGDNFSAFLSFRIGLGEHLTYTVSTWINDGLMAVFFLLVGLEIKREIAEGELSTMKQAALPVVAALGGMIFPALIYVVFNYGKAGASGWGIPMATDIAFALAIIAMLGKQVPFTLKIFLAALAIADDLGAIIVIAIFYTAQIHWYYLLAAGLIFAGLYVLNFLKVTKLIYYLIPGMLLWYCIHHSGIHATIAGVLLALTIPMYKNVFSSPVKKLEHKLKIPVNYFIMPIFALANTNIKFEYEMLNGLFSPIGLGIFLGLFFGKTIGISLFSWLAVKLNWAKLPASVTWNHIMGVGILAGIGFTMSIFIALLSFTQPEYISGAKFAILCTSIVAGSVGFIYLKLQPKPEPIIEETEDDYY
jgi:NhaA family Na+:H+ antiporter